MPLSPPAPRAPLHTRAILLRGYGRGDGLFDIEAHLTDTKPFAMANHDRGGIAAGEPVHEMWMRLTVDEAMRIVASEAATDLAPYAICAQAAPNFAALVGLQIGRGFLKQAALRVGGTAGCTHLRELLQQMATTALQTVAGARAGRQPAEPGDDAMDAAISAQMGGEARLLNSCLAFAVDGPVVRRRWPHLHAGGAG